MSQDSANMVDAHNPPPPPPYAIPKKRKGWKIFFRLVLGVSLLLNFSMCAMLFGTGMQPEDEMPTVVERLSWGERTAPVKAAVLRYDGMIMRRPQGLLGGGGDPVTRILREIQAVTVDPDVKAILFQVSSPGGGVTSSDEIYRALMRFKASDPERRIVVQIRDLAASGGYYISLPADVVVANPTAVVGSVGVMLSAVNFHELGEKIGMKDVTLTSSENKALLSSLKPVDPEHEEILQAVVDDLYAQFRDLVLESRPFDAAYAETHRLLDGRVFTARDALAHELVDELGYDDDARAAVSRLFANQDVAFYNISAPSGLAGLLGASASSPSLPALNLPFTGGAEFLYLWRP
ncbi:MAG: signal peptide peptidase SppA [Verrucomicrobia bacterium]|nr:signal peptide peptidase SppA [Verrucomicrobiota bacterium]MCH8514163.1 signal peptide peptidase SppA [Kiritimatiellia bacterium]